MSITLPLSGKTDSGIGAGASRLLIDPSCLVLSSEGYSNQDGLQEPLYGVPCLLHNDGAMGTVLVSSLTCGHDVYMQDDDIPEVCTHLHRVTLDLLLVQLHDLLLCRTFSSAYERSGDILIAASRHQ